jgi:hypothetical protein
MPFLIILAKIFLTMMTSAGILAGVFYIYLATKAPGYGKKVQTVAGTMVISLCVYASYFVWFLW